MIPPFELFGKSFGIYPTLILVGVFVAGAFACREAKKSGQDENDMIVFLLACAMGALVGGHVLYGLTNFGLILKLIQGLPALSSLGELWNQIYVIFGGMVFYGGLLGGVAAGVAYGRHKNHDLRLYSDIMAPAVPLFHVFGRIGCFLGGCCYGIACPMGITYTNNPIAQANGLSRFPVQLAEALFNLALFVLLYRWYKRGVFQGRLLCLYLCFYSAGRFLLEFLRGDEYRGFVGVLSTSQLISIPLFLAAATLFYKGRPGRSPSQC